MSANRAAGTPPATMPPTSPEAAALAFEDQLIALRWYVPHRQAALLRQLAKGEEKTFFIEKVAELHAQINAMPKSYEQDGKGGDAIAHLHYFTGAADFYITERDAGINGDGDMSVPQMQAFGLADPFGNGGEMGYINLREIGNAGAELDLHFMPKPLRELRPDRFKEVDAEASNGNDLPP